MVFLWIYFDFLGDLFMILIVENVGILVPNLS